METRCNILLRMAVVLGFFVVLQLPRVTASLLPIGTKCSTDHIDYSSNTGQDFFYVNGRLVDKELFCNTLKFYRAKDCFITEDKSNLCELDHSLEGLPSMAGRKFLHKLIREESTRHILLQKNQPNKDKKVHETLSTAKKFTIAIPGLFVLSCALMCPCFRARKKPTPDNVFPKDHSIDSTSPLEMHHIHEKIPGSPLRVPPSPSRFSPSPKLSRLGSIHLNMNQVLKYTQNFSPAVKVGEGGFGTVYKAQLPDGQIVAIKRAKKEHFELLKTEFSSEIELLSKIDHRNLVKILGYLDKGNERLIITEYVPNGTLREHLDGQRGGRILDFNQRLEISIDVAHALTYLHLYAEKQIIHRDVKSSNILLTESMRAKVADFGFARLGSMDSDKTHVSTKVKGTIGYLDPEYMRTYQLTPKSDVYSFGIVLLEILTGRRPVEMKKPTEERITLRWAFKKYSEGSAWEIMDPLMHEELDNSILMKMFDLAFQCAAPTRTDRPDMKTVGEQLWTIRMDYLRSGRRASG